MHTERHNLLFLHAEAAVGQIEWTALLSLLIALKYRDEATFFHSLRVADLAFRASGRLGLSAEARNDVLLAGLLHDIGKLALPDAVMHKTDRLTKRERKQISRHPSLGAEILSPFCGLDRVREIIRQHHERHDGSGYPDGRRSEETYLESSLLAAADAFDALCHSRPYRKPLTAEEAIGWLESESGRQFRPVATSALIEELEVAGVAATDFQGLLTPQPFPADELGTASSILSF